MAVASALTNRAVALSLVFCISALQLQDDENGTTNLTIPQNVTRPVVHLPAAVAEVVRLDDEHATANVTQAQNLTQPLAPLPGAMAEVLRLVTSGPLLHLPADTYPTARCLDGTMGAYYILPGDPSKFVVHFQGGGECLNKLSCNIRMYSPLGSSALMPFVHDFNAAGTLADTDATRNRDLANATMVRVPYCSGDLWSGQRTETSDETWGFWFSGHLIVRAVLGELVAKHGLAQAELIVWTGASAGAVGAVLSLDLAADKLREAGSKARVVGAALAGFSGLSKRPYLGPGNVWYMSWDPITTPLIANLWKSFVPKRCAAQYPQHQWLCLFAEYSVATIANEVMFINSHTDMLLLNVHHGVPGSPPFEGEVLDYVTNFNDRYRKEIAAAARPGVGVFTAACWTHSYLQGVRVQGLGYQDAFAKFLASPDHTLLVQDTCAGIGCNPDCLANPVVSDVSYNSLG